MFSNVQEIKLVRSRTRVSLAQCREALVETDGDVEKAVLLLEARGALTAARCANRPASEGLIQTYVHPGSRLAILVEINCQTDFAAASDDFRTFCEAVALQVAGMRPEFLRVEDVPADQASRPNERPLPARCLLSQESIVVPGKTLEQLRVELVARLGENVVVRRFVRYELGEEIDTPSRA